ncbi:hypothetical protein MUK42_19091 [Musa troglodytarum]|uniref:Uncharacterized protein n=1 Tax=Musa troglodytarum TaxID=320322 RepID=A0A9E7EKK9_9LILI|nr:hypothetical protein MUK42_19091 [Musa troglodytarum]
MEGHTSRSATLIRYRLVSTISTSRYLHRPPPPSSRSWTRRRPPRPRRTRVSAPWRR